MPPKRAVDASSKRSQPKGKAPAPEDEESDNPFTSSDEETRKAPARQSKKQRTREDAGGDDEQVVAGGARAEEGEEDEQPEKTIPKELLTRLLHEFFTKDATRISRDANATVGKYFDVFVREAIARTAVERQGGFLEVCSLFRP